jgi:hypothetical protein
MVKAALLRAARVSRKHLRRYSLRLGGPIFQPPAGINSRFKMASSGRSGSENDTANIVTRRLVNFNAANTDRSLTLEAPPQNALRRRQAFNVKPE